MWRSPLFWLLELEEGFGTHAQSMNKSDARRARGEKHPPPRRVDSLIRISRAAFALLAAPSGMFALLRHLFR